MCCNFLVHTDTVPIDLYSPRRSAHPAMVYEGCVLGTTDRHDVELGT
jgi:hypothetical protein